MLFFPNAKINIGLQVISKRPDGYHNIETVFCPVGLSDVLEFVPVPGAPRGEACLSITGIPVEGHVENNLCMKAYQILNNDFRLPATDIHLHKIIPSGAGLGGGSSDAAFMLKYLNIQYKLGLGEEQLCSYASQLGSDCAFFILNRPVLGYERGDKFREIGSFPENLEAIIVNPGIHVSTAGAYAGVHTGQPENTLEELIQLPVEKWRDHIRNDFETGIFKTHPEIGHLKNKLYDLGAVYASMSGSGSSVYGLFHKKAPALEDQFPECSYWSGPVLSRAGMA